MIVKTLTNGSVTGTGMLTCNSRIIGGVLITTDNVNQGIVILRRDSANGKRVLKIKTITSMWVAAPFSLEGTTKVYYDVSGTGCEAQIYEWIT